MSSNAKGERMISAEGGRFDSRLEPDCHHMRSAFVQAA